MERVFSVEEETPHLDPFWTSPSQLLLQPQVLSGGVIGAEINIGGGGTTAQSPSECFFHNFMDDSPLLDAPVPLAADLDANSKIYNNSAAEPSRKRHYEVHREDEEGDVVEVVPTPSAPMVASAVVDPIEYNAMLRRKLDVALEVVSMRRSSSGIHREGSGGNRASQNSNGSNNLGSPNHTGDVDAHKLSSSSLDPSPSEGDMEGDAETKGKRNVTTAKVKKRMESNRDSARRSRTRKAARMKELEEQVSLLRVENKSLMSRLAEVSQKYADAAIDNRVLKANVETLETKVKMSEETMKRLTSVRSLPQAISSMPSLGMPLSRSRLDNISNIPFATQDSQVSYFATANNVDINNTYIPESQTPTFQIHNPSASLYMHPMVSFDHHQVRVSGGMPSISVPTQQWESTMLDQSDFANMGMQ